MPRQQIEHQHQCALIRWADGKAKRYPQVGMLFAIPNAGGYTGGYKANVLRVIAMKAEGVRRGIPDLFLPVVKLKELDDDYYGGLWIEMKSPNSATTIEQDSWMSNLAKEGYKVALCFSWVEAALAICKYLGIPHDELDHAA